jgi:hypothetical protein
MAISVEDAIGPIEALARQYALRIPNDADGIGAIGRSDSDIGAAKSMRRP